MRFCAFLIMSIVLLHKERSFEIVEPKNFTVSACFLFAKINDHFHRFGYV